MTRRQIGVLKSWLAEIYDDYNYILIDTPPSESLITDSAFIASHYVLIPVLPEPDALDGVGKVISSVEEIRSGLNPELRVIGILPTMVRETTALHKLGLRDLTAKYPDLIIKDWIPHTVRFGESVLEGKPLLVTEPNIEAAERYRKLAARLL